MKINGLDIKINGLDIKINGLEIMHVDFPVSPYRSPKRKYKDNMTYNKHGLKK